MMNFSLIWQRRFYGASGTSVFARRNVLAAHCSKPCKLNWFSFPKLWVAFWCPCGNEFSAVCKEGCRAGVRALGLRVQSCLGFRGVGFRV